jgi:hypothetical protein
MRVRALILGALCVPLLMLSCGYGKDTGPKQPKSSPLFAPLADRFQARCKACFDDVFHVNMGRQISPAERSDAARMQKAMSSFRQELMQCMSGKGYGNETQVEASVVEVWLAHTGCPQFAQAAFKAPQCIAIQSVLEEAGYPEEGASPPKAPPRKKRPRAAPPSK